MPTQHPFDDLVSARRSLVVVVKADDCGCGCDGKGDCGDHTRRTHTERVVVPGLVHSSPEALEAKAAAHVSSSGGRLLPTGSDDVTYPRLATKVGSVGSHDPVLQGVQAVASYVTPGDMSPVRSPVRSGVYTALTPGGGGGGRGRRLRSIGRQVVRRCPPGFEHGGRFTNAALSNCGSRLFDIADGPDAPDLVGGVAGVAGAARRTIGGAVVGRSTVNDVLAGRYGPSPIIKRAADIPEVGKPNRSRFKDAVEAQVVAAGSAKDGFVRFVRPDGVVVKPVASMSKLLKQRDNPEITGSTLVMSAVRPTGIGGEEMKLLGSGLSEVRYVLPGGSSLSLKAPKGLTPRRAAALHRQLEGLRKGGDEHGRALRMLAETSRGDLTFAAEYKNMEQAGDMVVMERNGIRRTVQKWAFLTWYAASAPGRTRTGSAWRLIDEGNG